MDKWKFLLDAQDKAAKNPLRKERLTSLLAEWSTFHADDPDFLTERLVSEGFFTRDQLWKLRKQASRIEKAGEVEEHYPWTKMPPNSLAELIRGNDLKETVLAMADKFNWTVSDSRREVGVRLLGAMYLWLKSKNRMFVRVRGDASFLLRKLSMDREKEGKPPVDWRERPSAGSAVFDEPMMLWWEGATRHMTFVSMGPDAMTYVHWTFAKPNPSMTGWATLYTTPPTVNEAIIREMNDRRQERPMYFVNEVEKQRVIEQMGVDDVSEYTETVPYLNGSFNLLAAMNAAPRFAVLRPNKGGKGRSTLGGIRGVRVCELDMGELTKWSEYYTNLKPRKE